MRRHGGYRAPQGVQAREVSTAEAPGTLAEARASCSLQWRRNQRRPYAQATRTLRRGPYGRRTSARSRKPVVPHVVEPDVPWRIWTGSGEPARTALGTMLAPAAPPGDRPGGWPIQLSRYVANRSMDLVVRAQGCGPGWSLRWTDRNGIENGQALGTWWLASGGDVLDIQTSGKTAKPGATYRFWFYGTPTLGVDGEQTKPIDLKRSSGRSAIPGAMELTLAPARALSMRLTRRDRSASGCRRARSASTLPKPPRAGRSHSGLPTISRSSTVLLPVRAKGPALTLDAARTRPGQAYRIQAAPCQPTTSARCVWPGRVRPAACSLSIAPIVQLGVCSGSKWSAPTHFH